MTMTTAEFYQRRTEYIARNFPDGVPTYQHELLPGSGGTITAIQPAVDRAITDAVYKEALAELVDQVKWRVWVDVRDTDVKMLGRLLDSVRAAGMPEGRKLLSLTERGALLSVPEDTAEAAINEHELMGLMGFNSRVCADIGGAIIPF